MNVVAHDIFISYASEDKRIADALCARLEERGIRCWIAPRDVLSGKDWSESIVDAIAGSRGLVLVFSSHANASPHIKREVDRAVTRGIPIVPLRIEDVMPTAALEYYISSVHWLDAITPPLDAHLHALGDKIAALLGQPVVEKPEHEGRRPAAGRRWVLWLGGAATVSAAAIVFLWLLGSRDTAPVVPERTPAPVLSRPTPSTAAAPAFDGSALRDRLLTGLLAGGIRGVEVGVPSEFRVEIALETPDANQAYRVISVVRQRIARGTTLAYRFRLRGEEEVGGWAPRRGVPADPETGRAAVLDQLARYAGRAGLELAVEVGADLRAKLTGRMSTIDYAQRILRIPQSVGLRGVVYDVEVAGEYPGR
jgi:TIR domain-containing protein